LWHQHGLSGPHWRVAGSWPCCSTRHYQSKFVRSIVGRRGWAGQGEAVQLNRSVDSQKTKLRRRGGSGPLEDDRQLRLALPLAGAAFVMMARVRVLPGAIVLHISRAWGGGGVPLVIRLIASVDSPLFVIRTESEPHRWAYPRRLSDHLIRSIFSQPACSFVSERGAEPFGRLMPRCVCSSLLMDQERGGYRSALIAW